MEAPIIYSGVLTETDLSEANLTGAKLLVVLCGADLSNATLTKTKVATREKRE